VDTAAASTSYGTGKSHLQLKKMKTEDTKVEHVEAQNSSGQSKVTVSVSKKLKTEERVMIMKFSIHFFLCICFLLILT
jgi:hypothetical protein